jgi:hypothetical protein
VEPLRPVVGLFVIGDHAAWGADLGLVMVGQDQHVALLLVAEVVVDPLLFEQPGDEVEVTLLVLHADLSLAGRVRELELVVPEAVGPEDVLQDGLDVLLVEDPAVLLLREQPQPGHELQPVQDRGRGDLLLCEARDHARDDPSIAVVEAQVDGGWRSDHAVEVDLAIDGVDLELEVEEL